MKGMVSSLAAAKRMRPGKARNKALVQAQSALDQAQSDLATIFELDRGWSTDQSMGYVKTLMGIEGTADVAKGKGAHRADSMKTARGTAIKKAGQFEGARGQRMAMIEAGLDPSTGKQFVDQNGQPLGAGALSEKIKQMTDTAAKEDAAAAAAAKSAGGGDLNATIDSLDAILRKFVGQLHGSVGGAAGPPQ